MKPRFQNKVAIVTGAGCVGEGWGNGRAIAVRLAEEGARVLAVDRDRARLDETLERAGAASASIEPWTGDVTNSASVASMAAACIEAFGTIDILINNVGGSAAGGPVEMGEDVWDTQVDFNLKSVFLSCKHVLPTLLAKRSGAIVNIASTSGAALDRRGAGGLCRDQGRGDPVVAGRRGPTCRAGRARQYRRAGPAAHADGRNPARQTTRGR